MELEALIESLPQQIEEFDNACSLLDSCSSRSRRIDEFQEMHDNAARALIETARKIARFA